MTRALRSRGDAGIAGNVLVYAVAFLLVVLLTYAATTLGVTAGLVAVGAAAFFAILCVLGGTRTGVLLLTGAFFTAPMYKGLAPSAESVVTPTDLLFVAGFAFLAPRLFKGAAHLPTTYAVGVTIVATMGLAASALSEDPVTSFVALTFWLVVMVALPVAIATWGPSAREIDLMAWAFVAGQVLSTGIGLIEGPLVQDRYFGQTTHPNYFGQSGLLAVALMLYLAPRYLRSRPVVVIGAGAICAMSIVMSGSRAATVVAAVLVLMVPVVERSAVRGFLIATCGALTLLALPLVFATAGDGTSLARLGADDVSADASSQARGDGFDVGVERFLADPFVGTGLIDLFEIHNNFLEVAVATGVLGLIGYLLVVGTFALPLFGRGPHRRLAYGVWAYIGMGATVPGLYDRSVWAVVALGVVAVVHRHAVDPRETPSDEPAPSVKALAGRGTPVGVAGDRS